MLVRFECVNENFPKVQLEHVPVRGDAVEIFGSWYEVLSTDYETVIRKKPSGKTSVVQVAVCDIRKIVIGNFQADKQEDKWKPHSEFCNREAE